MDKLDVVIKSCDDAIRKGNTALASRLIDRVNINDIPRRFRQPLAALCRRTGKFTQALKILSSVIRAKNAEIQSTPSEDAEYAASLQILGAISEAETLLDRAIVTRTTPEAFLFRAFCHFGQWQYEKSIEPLKTYLSFDLNEYQRRVGLVNLASAFVVLGRLDEALDILNQQITQTRTAGLRRLLGNCHEMRAQVFMRKGRAEIAADDLEIANSMLSHVQGWDHIFVQKWRAVLRGKETGDVSDLLLVRKVAEERGDWESVRDIDRQALMIQFDSDRFHRLIFGTPYPDYRQMIFKEVDRAPEITSFLSGDPKGKAFDIADGLINGVECLAPGSKIHQLLMALSMDLYRPAPLGMVFSHLFPEFHFDIFSSANRVHQIIFRARHWVEQHSLPLDIIEERGAYKLNVNSGLHIRLNLNRRPEESDDIFFEHLKSHYRPGEYFEAIDARERLNLSRSKFQRLMRRVLDDGLVEMSGIRTRALYQIKT